MPILEFAVKSEMVARGAGGGKSGGVSCVLGNDLADNVVHVDLLQKVR